MDELFVYGTLHPERAPMEIAETVRRLRRVGEGTVRGKLLRLEGYPGLVGGDDVVEGTVFRVPAELWAELDAYEGYVAGRAEESLFVREQIDVRMGGGVRRCWVYRYRGFKVD